MATKTERLKNQQREYESQMQYRQHLQVCPPPHTLTHTHTHTRTHTHTPHTHTPTHTHTHTHTPSHTHTHTHFSQDFINRWRYNAKRASQAQMRIKVLEKLPVLTPVESEGEVILRFPDIDKLSPPILQLTEVRNKYLLYIATKFGIQKPLRLSKYKKCSFNVTRRYTIHRYT